MRAFLRILFRRRRVGRHRPDTVIPVGGMYRITYPGLYRQYLPYVQQYGYGAEQAAYWVWRTVRLAELRAAREERLRGRGYRWLVLFEPTAEHRELVSA